MASETRKKKKKKMVRSAAEDPTNSNIIEAIAATKPKIKV